ncbi:gamma carbonic anhydrase family protein [Bacillus fonticola]|uniref:gamma carbonic anhydrase family protein n=1 Tax=Bacillus fonticola TaxID=2728853 RepID=UPI001D13FB2B|nr:gamma carbonic anhydrase family protein [Bacillus fonticola]
MVHQHATVGHNVILHGCTIMEDALIGMGSTILNGAVIGAGALVAAGSLVREGMTVSPGMLVAGVPAKEIRKLSENDLDRMKSGTYHYIENGKHFAEKLRKLD